MLTVYCKSSGLWLLSKKRPQTEIRAHGERQQAIGAHHAAKLHAFFPVRRVILASLSYTLEAYRYPIVDRT